MLSSTLRLRFFLRSISCRPVSDKNYLFDPFVLSTSALCVRVACRVARLVSRLQVCSTYFMRIRSKYIIIRLAAGTEKQLGPKYPGNMREYPGSRQRGKCLTPVGNFFGEFAHPKITKQNCWSLSLSNKNYVFPSGLALGPRKKNKKKCQNPFQLNCDLGRH